ncbi:CRISPR-associated endonuclease Cas2 [Candidatus Gottesmanbacteria bacterium]|nr:CRISPR-associated endonuclease Cas2 [Candidatus Gottesmanbacteria bacterium]
MGRFSAKEISFGILGSLTDFLIWYTALVGASIGRSGPRGVYRAFYEADQILNQVNHQTIAAAWSQLFKKKLLTYKKRNNLYTPAVTKFGWERLKEQIPKFYEKRPWDGKIYLITYDIPETKSRQRSLLRSFLKKLGAAMLQESVWLTPYNPREIINRFVLKNEIQGTVIISDMGRGGGVGETNIQDLIIRLYKLEKLNERYEKFISKGKNERSEFIKNAQSPKIPKPYLVFEYLSILEDDPQLPFELLPKAWLGNQAFKIYQSLLPKNS